MKINKKSLIAGAASVLGTLTLLTGTASAASSFSDHLWQFTAGASSSINFNQGSSMISNDSQLYVETDDWLILKAGTQVIVSNDLGVGGSARANTVNAVNGLTVGAGGANITGNSTVAGTLGGLTGLTVGASGTALTQMRVYAPSITPTATAGAIGTYQQTSTVTGLTTADKVIVNGPAPTSLCPLVGYRVSAANTLQLDFSTLTAAACTPAAGTYTVVAIRS